MDTWAAIRIGWLLTLVIGSAGCATSSEDLRGRDDGFSTGRVRLSMGWSSTPKASAPAVDSEGAEYESVPDSFYTAGFTDFELSYGEGNFDDTVSPSGNVRIDDVRFPGGSRLEGRYQLAHAAVLGRFRLGMNRHFAIDLMAGLSAHRLQLQIESQGLRDREHVLSFGPQAGVMVTWSPFELLETYARVDGSAELGRSYGIQNSNAEFGFTIVPVDQVGLSLGWRWDRYKAERSGRRSDIDLRSNGPHFTVEVRF